MNSIPKTITAEWLTVHDACEEQQALFEKTWPDGAHVTKRALVRAAKVGLNLEWFTGRVLPRSLYAGYRAKCDALLIEIIWAARTAERQAV